MFREYGLAPLRSIAGNGGTIAHVANSPPRKTNAIRRIQTRTVRFLFMNDCPHDSRGLRNASWPSGFSLRPAGGFRLLAAERPIFVADGPQPLDSSASCDNSYRKAASISAAEMPA